MMAFSSKQILGDVLVWTQVENGKAVQPCLPQAKVEKRKRFTWGGGGEEVVAAEFQSCPRCNSTDTKFCYFNNYNKSQPRHLCRACKRHWTVGGTLRDVPVGGARKNKRSRPAKKTSNSTTLPPPTTPCLPLFTEINNGADDDHLYDDALDASDEIFPFGPDLTNVGSSSSTPGEHHHELPMAGSDSSWSSDLLPVGFLESSSWNWEDLVQCLSTDQQTCSFTF